MAISSQTEVRERDVFNDEKCQGLLQNKWMNQINHDGKCPWVSGCVFFCLCVFVLRWIALAAAVIANAKAKLTKAWKGFLCNHNWLHMNRNRLNCVWSWESEIEGVFIIILFVTLLIGTVFLQSPFLPCYIKLSLPENIQFHLCTRQQFIKPPRRRRGIILCGRKRKRIKSHTGFPSTYCNVCYSTRCSCDAQSTNTTGQFNRAFSTEMRFMFANM